MRLLSSILLLSTGLALAANDAAQAQQSGRAERLLGGNENPPVISDGTGQFLSEISDDQITFELSYDGLADVQEAHLHIANPSNNGGIVVFLCSNLGNVPVGATVRECLPPPNVVTGDIIATDVLPVVEDTTTIIAAGDLPGLVRLIRQGSVYANVHTLAHPPGEIRGQLFPRIR